MTDMWVKKGHVPVTCCRRCNCPAEAACYWIPACAGMTASEETRNSPPYIVIPAQAGNQKGSEHCDI